MKKLLTGLMTLVMLSVTMLSCKKDVDGPSNGGGNPVDTSTIRKFKFLVQTLPGEVQPLHGLTATLSVINEDNDPVIIDKQVELTHIDKYISAAVTLPKGNYKLNKFLLYKDQKVKFATPYLNSAKAAEVAAPLAIGFTLANDSIKLIPVEVARVSPGDRSEHFGYAPGLFGEPGNDPVPSHVKIRIQPLIRIGEVVYDSIPVTLTVVTTDHAGQSTSQNHILTAGTNDLWLLNSAFKYKFKLSKWGTYDEMTVLRSQLLTGTVYSLGGTRQANNLKEVLTYKLVNGTYLPETRMVYVYNTSGKVGEILHYRKRPDNTNYISMREELEYAGAKVQLVKRYDENNQVAGSTSFEYAGDGKLLKIIQKEGASQTTGNVTYSPMPGGTGISGNHRINVQLQYSHLYYTANYSADISGGNMQQDHYTTSNGIYKGGQYQYDFGVNPYIHLGIPDLFLSNYSKHNAVSDVKTYAIQFPITEPYDFNYSYGSDGFPLELITKHRTYLSKQYSHTIKTVFKY